MGYSRTEVLSTIHVARNMELTASVNDVRDEQTRGEEIYAGITILFGRSATASVAHVRDGRGSRMTVDAQRSLPVGEGYGYQLHTRHPPNNQNVSVTVYGRIPAQQDVSAGNYTDTVSAVINF